MSFSSILQSYILPYLLYLIFNFTHHFINVHKFHLFSIFSLLCSHCIAVICVSMCPLLWQNNFPHRIIYLYPTGAPHQHPAGKRRVAFHPAGWKTRSVKCSNKPKSDMQTAVRTINTASSPAPSNKTSLQPSHLYCVVDQQGFLPSDAFAPSIWCIHLRCSLTVLVDTSKKNLKCDHLPDV